MKPSDYVTGDPSTVRHDFVDLADLPFGLDIRYAREDNFLGRPVYPAEKAFLQKPAADALLRAHRRLEAQGYGILVFDGYRPWSVTKLFYDEADDHQKEFLANPERGSVHNRGCAIDCSLYRLKDGREVRMTSEFDEMNESAWSDYKGGTPEERKHRDLLIGAMHAEGYKVLKREWWHFNHPSAGDYPVYDWSFEAISKALGG
ncbi:MAG: M15 family metallopeptidase [Bdellovibrionales bacterium]|nr:M15 family metallopeptidase [Bdellovibrionales bacterium]